MYISQKMSIFIIMGVMEHINIRSSQIGVEKKENCKFTTLQVLNLLMLFPFFIVKNASRYSRVDTQTRTAPFLDCHLPVMKIGQPSRSSSWMSGF